MENKENMDHRLKNPKFREWLKQFGMDPDLVEMDLGVYELNDLWEEFLIEEG